jgi:hypothetical protein
MEPGIISLRSAAVSRSNPYRTVSPAYLNLLKLIDWDERRQSAVECVRALVYTSAPTSFHTELCVLAMSIRRLSDLQLTTAELCQLIFNKDELLHIANTHFHPTCSNVEGECVAVWSQFGPPATAHEVLAGERPLGALKINDTGIDNMDIIAYMAGVDAMFTQNTGRSLEILFYSWKKSAASRGYVDVYDLNCYIPFIPKFKRTLMFYLTLFLHSMRRYGDLQPLDVVLHTDTGDVSKTGLIALALYTILHGPFPRTPSQPDNYVFCALLEYKYKEHNSWFLVFFKTYKKLMSVGYDDIQNNVYVRQMIETRTVKNKTDSDTMCCCVCLEDFRDQDLVVGCDTATNTKHLVCITCHNRMISQDDPCPMCRSIKPIFCIFSSGEI